MTKLRCRSLGNRLWVLDGIYNGKEVYVLGGNECECVDKLLTLVKAA